MSNDDEEWKVVTKADKKRVSTKVRKKKSSVKEESSYARDAASEICKQDFETMLSKCRHEMASTKFRTAIDEAASLGGSPPSSIVCYGIGNFGVQQSVPSAPLWQLACILELREVVQSRREQGSVPVFFYEPLMTPHEADLLQSLSIHIIHRNERGKRKVDHPTFFFMPHCPMALYSNLLFANRERVGNIVILGNSLVAYANRLQSNSHTEFLKQLEPFWVERAINISKDEVGSLSGYFEQAFNDQAVVFFPANPDIRIPEAIVKEMTKSRDEYSSSSSEVV